jgi:hypothetical protein
VRRLRRTKSFELMCWSQILGNLHHPEGQPQRLRPNTAGWAAWRSLQKENHLSLRLEQNNLLVYAD